MKAVDFHGYTIYEDGTVIGLHGKPIKVRIRKNRKEVGLRINGKARYFLLARLVFYLFKPFDISNRDLCVVFKDKNPMNVHLSNLALVKRENLIKEGRPRNSSSAKV